MFHTTLSRCTLAAAQYSKSLTLLRQFSSEIDFAKLIKNNKVVVFMKGVPEQPRCGYSGVVVQILRMHGVDFDAHDVLTSWDMREGIKKFSDWPTIPQIFFNGEFIGGSDIIVKMHKSGELITKLQEAGIKSALLEEEEKQKKEEGKEVKKGMKTNKK